MEYISQKDQIIEKLNEEVARLIGETKKLQRNISRDKQRSKDKEKFDKGFNLNVRVNPSSGFVEK